MVAAVFVGRPTLACEDGHRLSVCSSSCPRRRSDSLLQSCQIIVDLADRFIQIRRDPTVLSEIVEPGSPRLRWSTQRYWLRMRAAASKRFVDVLAQALRLHLGLHQEHEIHQIFNA